MMSAEVLIVTDLCLFGLLLWLMALTIWCLAWISQLDKRSHALRDEVALLRYSFVTYLQVEVKQLDQDIEQAGRK